LHLRQHRNDRGQDLSRSLGYIRFSHVHAFDEEINSYRSLIAIMSKARANDVDHPE
jgi:hypothetical protein